MAYHLLIDIRSPRKRWAKLGPVAWMNKKKDTGIKIESDKSMQKFSWEVLLLSLLSSAFGMRVLLWWGFFEAQLLFCECIWLTGGAQQGPRLSMVIHTVGSKSYQYNLNGKETTGLNCPCFTMLESWHLAYVWAPKLQFSQFSTVLCGFWRSGSDE